MKNDDDFAEKEDPIYLILGRIIMQQKKEVTSIDFDDLTQALTKRSERLFFGIKPPTKLTIHVPDDQTREIIQEIQSTVLPRIDHSALTAHLPELSDDELGRRAFKLLIGPAKEPNNHNPFGGEWNEWTAKIAAKKLRIPLANLSVIMDSSGPLGVKLREAQSQSSREAEAMLIKSLSTEVPEETKFLVSTETWLKSRIDELRDDLATDKSELTKSEKTSVIKDIVSAFVQITNFSRDQSMSFPKLKRTLTNGRLGEPVSIVELHCLPFRNSTTEGISVIDSAQPQTDTGPRKGQHEILDSVNQFADILGENNIDHKITLLVIDNDRFVDNGQSENINRFIASLKETVKSHAINKHHCEIRKASETINANIFSNEWDVRHRATVSKGQAKSLTARLAKSELEKLQAKPLPAAMKTKEFAQETARKLFLLQTSLGATLPKIFDNLITLQRSRAPQQATELFVLGAKLAKQDPIIICHSDKSV